MPFQIAAMNCRWCYGLAKSYAKRLADEKDETSRQVILQDRFEDMRLLKVRNYAMEALERDRDNCFHMMDKAAIDEILDACEECDKRDYSSPAIAEGVKKLKEKS